MNRNNVRWNDRIREATRSGQDMTLDEILFAMTKTTDFTGCQDPRHNLRGFLAKAVEDGWMTRVTRGVFRLNVPRRGAGRAQFMEPTLAVASEPVSVISEVRTPRRRRRRRTNKTLKITVGDITLQTPPGMRPDAIHRLVEAIRGTY